MSPEVIASKLAEDEAFEEDADAIQNRIFREMTPEQKLHLAERLYYSARDLKAAGVRLQHPDWSEEAVQKKVREIFLYAAV